MSGKTLVDFTLEGEPPRTAQSRLRVFKNKAGRIFLGKTRHKPSEAFLTRLTLLARRAFLEANQCHPWESPDKASHKAAGTAYRVTLEFSYPHPSGTRKADREKPSLRTARPDLDNLSKSTLDAIVRSGVLPDDGQVSTLVLRKFNSPKPGLRVVVSIDSL